MKELKPCPFEVCKQIPKQVDKRKYLVVHKPECPISELWNTVRHWIVGRGRIEAWNTRIKGKG